MPALRRQDSADETARVSTLELFYDLVFVFAITQVSHLLLEHLDWTGAGQTALVLLVIWWSWNFTTWATNELDPDATWVRMLLIGLMLLSLTMAIAIPEAFGDHALLFAGSYVSIQLTRQGFLTFVAGRPGTVERERALQILVWFSATAPLWIAGAILEGDARTILWIAALVIDYSGPLCTFRLPGRRVAPEAWQVEPAHMAERFQLFVIIALGESIVIAGATTSDLPIDLERVLALAIAFLGTAALWWLYFGAIAERVGGLLAGAENDRTLVARDIYTYLHVVLVAGIVVSAVGDELVIKHPGEELPTKELIALTAGPVLYLLAQDLMRFRGRGDVSATRTGGILGCVAVGFLGLALPALATAALIVVVLAAVIFESERRRRARVATG
jgi:low temperature requirement protein LtrA